jgi:hypothetical protein
MRVIGFKRPSEELRLGSSTITCDIQTAAKRKGPQSGGAEPVRPKSPKLSAMRLEYPQPLRSSNSFGRAMLNLTNLFAEIPAELAKELTKTLVASPNVRIERIVSKGHTSDSRYDQDENELVLLVSGATRLQAERFRQHSGPKAASSRVD